ncbi:hypothetical protein V8J88_06845 [Massilia sp. W12]|uniref:hypothetical protein n=1 Tax=Massilia sp. W12 TaxID=3126507 RepID=UPI0030CC1DF5
MTGIVSLFLQKLHYENALECKDQGIKVSILQIRSVSNQRLLFRRRVFTGPYHLPLNLKVVLFQQDQKNFSSLRKAPCAHSCRGWHARPAAQPEYDRRYAGHWPRPGGG